MKGIMKKPKKKPVTRYPKLESIRVCAEHMYPVGLTQDSPEFVCLLKYERMEINQTVVMALDEVQPYSQLVQLVTARGDCAKRKK